MGGSGRWMSTGIALSVLAFSRAQEPPAMCGEFAGCSTEEGGFTLNQSVTLQGYLGGYMNVVATRYNGTDCNGSTPLYEYVMSGSYSDLGGESDAATRRVYFDYNGISVTPLSSEGVDMLVQSCACTSAATPPQWIEGSAMQLASCDVGTCDTALFGGLPNGTTGELVVGQPAFALIAVSTENASAATTTQLGFSQLGSVPDAVFGGSTAANFSAVSANASNLCTTTNQVNMCGQYATYCRPVLDNTGTPVGGLRSQLTYRGPNTGYAPAGACSDPASVICPAAWGIYNLTGTAFLDELCTMPALTFSEIGAMGNLGNGVFGGSGYVNAFGKLGRTITVTPITQGAADALQEECPCGSVSTWTPNSTRTITTCPNDNCTASSLWWHDSQPFGTPVYAKGVFNVTTLSSPSGPISSLATSAWVTDYLQVTGQTLANSDPQVLASTTCGLDTNSQDYCGTYLSECSAESNAAVGLTAVQFDEQNGYAFFGDATQDGATDGSLIYTKQLYNNTGAATPCMPNQSVLSVIARGYYSIQDLPRNVYQFDTGYQQVAMTFSSLSVTPVGDEWIALLQAFCPCGNSSAWQSNVTRALGSCASGCPDLVAAGIFPGGVFGQTGFGVVQQNAGQLRVTQLAPNASAGTAPFDMASPILPRMSAPCANADPSPSLCGTWELPCHLIGSADTNSFASTATFIASGQGVTPCSECYYSNATYFSGDTGCEDNSPAAYIQVEQFGFYGIPGASNTPDVPHGYNLLVTTEEFVITPLSQAAVADLQANCSCPSNGGSWALGSPRSFSTLCSAAECPSTLFRQVVGNGTLYGTFQHLGQNLRITQLQATQSAGWANANLSRFDYQYISADGTCTPHLPAYPVKPNPHPSPIPATQNPSSKEMSGGDVFLLILFLTMGVYFGVGMAYNYRNNGGVPTIPHASFWGSLPGLAMDGCHFTFIKRCGFADSTGGGYGHL